MNTTPETFAAHDGTQFSSALQRDMYQEAEKLTIWLAMEEPCWNDQGWPASTGYTVRKEFVSTLATLIVNRFKLVERLPVPELRHITA